MPMFFLRKVLKLKVLKVQSQVKGSQVSGLLIVGPGKSL